MVSCLLATLNPQKHCELRLTLFDTLTGLFRGKTPLNHSHNGLLYQNYPKYVLIFIITYIKTMIYLLLGARARVVPVD